MISMLLWNKEKEQIIKELKKTVVKTVVKNLQSNRKKIQVKVKKSNLRNCYHKNQMPSQ
jgi:hypothetical protein